MDDQDICPPHGTPRLVRHRDDVPLILFDVTIYRQSPGFVRVLTFLSADRRKVDQIVETGPTLSGPWRELKRHL